MLEDLRKQVLEANLELVHRGLVLYTFGNASGIAREDGLVVIKPSGIPYEHMTAHHLVITDLEGKTVEGNLRPSSDLATHLILYRAFPTIGGVVHTHSRHATAWAQANREIPCLGTTHADYFYGSVPVTEPMKEEEIVNDYEANTGHVIVRRFHSLDPDQIHAVLVAGHGPFCWGQSVSDAARVAIVLEEIARMAFHTVLLNPDIGSLGKELLDKHYLRKHGPGAYYGQ
jgi:L-ribulose-5-phosphate 4-epimerase